MPDGKTARSWPLPSNPSTRPSMAESAEEELEAFAQGPWGKKFPTIAPAWRRVWDKVIPFFAFPPEVRRILYTTNAIESVNARLRQDHQDPRPLQRRRRDQAPLAGSEKHHHHLGPTRPPLEGRHEPVCYPLWTALYQRCRGTSLTTSHTKFLTLPFASFFWQAGFGAFSVSQSQVEDVRAYIRNQREHHRVKSFQEELRAFLKAYEIEFDERYVWD